MGRLEQEARDERVRQQQERVTVYASLPYQTFMVHAIKGPVMESFCKLASPGAGMREKAMALIELRKASNAFFKLPEPQHGIHKESGLPYVWHPNSYLLIDLRDEFFRHCVGLAEYRLKFIRAVINFVIILYDYDPPYRMMIDWWAKQLNIQNWRYDIPITVVNHNWTWWKE